MGSYNYTISIDRLGEQLLSCMTTDWCTTTKRI